MLPALNRDARRRPADLIKPKNGRHYVALLAGGAHDRFIELRDEWAKQRGIWVQHHWEYHRPKAWDGNIPRDVDVVFGLNAWMSHSLEAKLKAAVTRSQTPYFRVEKGQGAKLTEYGFRLAPPVRLVKDSDEISSHDVENALAPLGEMNATLALIGEMEDVSMENMPATVEDSTLPTMAEDNPLLASLRQLIELMPGNRVSHVAVTTTPDGGGQITMQWAKSA